MGVNGEGKELLRWQFILMCDSYHIMVVKACICLLLCNEDVVFLFSCLFPKLTCVQADAVKSSRAILRDSNSHSIGLSVYLKHF